jgi:hypothetical protein
MPLLREKTIASQALGPSGTPDLLQVGPIIDYTSLDKQLAIASEVRLAELLPDLRHPSTSYHLPPAAEDIISAVEEKMSSGVCRSLSRNDFSVALDPLAYDPDDSSPGTGSYIAASSFDREFSVITTNLAPYARTIAHEYQRRDAERLRISNLLSVGGKRRQTRAANAAMDGGRRSERRARYFELLRKMEFNVDSVLATGGEGWGSLPTGHTTGADSVADEEVGSFKGTPDGDAME